MPRWKKLHVIKVEEIKPAKVTPIQIGKELVGKVIEKLP